MTEPILNAQAPVQEKPKPDLELNFERQRRHYEGVIAEERAKREEAERKLRPAVSDEEDESDEPYVDRRSLKRELSKFGEQSKQQTVQEVQEIVQQALEKERQSAYLKENSDFNSVMSPEIIQKFADKYPRLAENILKMPDGFQRQRLVYENIKAMGLDKPESKEPSIQDRVNQNRQHPGYQPSGPGSAPYSSSGDFSEEGQKSAYAKLQQLKKNLRL